MAPTGSDDEGTFAEVSKKRLKSKLQEKYQHVSEGIAKAGKTTLLEQIYTELYITEGGTGEVNNEHEVRQIEAASRKPDGAETTIRQEDIFKPPPGRDKPIRTVMTKGVAGIGKTVLTQKFSLDWAEGRTNQDIQFLLPFTFRQLNGLKERKFSLVELIHRFFTETKGICNFEDFQVVFIFDGLDECRLPLDFHNNEFMTDVTESTSVDVLLTNLIRRNLLPSARLWITTRPAAANQIPPECVSMVTEVRGFTDPQKEEYFRKRFRDEEQTRIISHIKTSRSLHIMCHIPVFCWITASVLENVLKTREAGGLPKTLTEMYIRFLVVQAKLKKVKFDGRAGTDPHWSEDTRNMVESLGKLAFEQLQKGNLIFYEPDLRECGINVREASVYSGVFTQIFREESLDQDQVFCFIHLSVQEFLAALHVHQTFISSGVNLLEEEKNIFWWFKKRADTHLYQSAVDKALQSPNGHLDLFLRFLLGLSLETNQNLLRGLMEPEQRSSQNNQETVKYIKKKISDDLSAERSINLFHCLNELNDGSLVEEVQRYLRSGRLSTDELSPAQWSALVFILLSSGDLEEFDLKKFSASEQALRRLLRDVAVWSHICFFINNGWCKDVTVMQQHCSPDLEIFIINCKPFYSPREFSSFILVGVYITPQAHVQDAQRVLADHILNVERTNPDSLVTVLGDFNKGNLSHELPKYRQLIKCPTREGKILDHCYSTVSRAYHAVPRAALGHSDHLMVHLIPAYKQKLKLCKPAVRTSKQWTRKATEDLQACLDSTDWDVFRTSSSSLDELTEAVTSYISFCEDSCIPTRTRVVYNNDKPWFSSKLRRLRLQKEEAFRSGDKDRLKKAKYTFSKEVRAAKRLYSEKLRQQFSDNDASSVWKGLRQITNYKPRAPPSINDRRLANNLNQFYCRFERQRDSPDTIPPDYIHIPQSHSSNSPPPSPDSDVEQLSDLVKSPDYQLQYLRWRYGLSVQDGRVVS
ncbi:NLR family CARD domain-containing protein 3-like [Cololabis saira]|uniref:NLR family CARD domain-containing protein 3-like n=1 Tax=Cololabis saira TaxID=129043 RepID=UPI002AD2FA00|nr:NLR family CARD domain-containing protein 3-like [Cololabis saira]